MLNVIITFFMELRGGFCFSECLISHIKGVDVVLINTFLWALCLIKVVEKKSETREAD